MTFTKSAMKNLPAYSLFLIFTLLASPNLAKGQEDKEFKMAAIDAQRVFQEFYKTERTESEINEARIRIQKADLQMRAEVRKVERIITEEAEKGNNEASSEEEKKALSERVTQMIDGRNKMNQERVNRYDESNKQLNSDMLNTMTGILGEIERFVKVYGEKNGFDIVFDISGTSTNQLPPVLGGKSLVDITTAVIAELNGGKPDVDPKR